jgi:hypothetical protein
MIDLNKPVQTRNGLAARVICRDRKDLDSGIHRLTVAVLVETTPKNKALSSTWRKTGE